MAIINLPNGVGATLGDSLVVNSPLEFNGNIWYVDSATGADAASPKGRNRNAPLATLDQAVTNSAAGDMIVLMDGHAETITSAVAVNKSLTIVGAGQSSGKPTVKLTNNQAAGAVLTCTGSDVQVRNIWFPTNTQACSARRVTTSGGNYFRMIGCYFEFGANDDASGLGLAGTTVEIRNTTFVVTATDNTAQPDTAVDLSGTVSAIIMEGVVFDGGEAGFSDYFAMDLSDSAVTSFYLENLSLLNGADIKVLAASEGYVNVGTSGGGARVDWCGITEPA